MRVSMLVGAMLLTVNLAQQTSGADKKKDAEIACSAEHLDKSWNLSVKSMAVKETLLERLGETKFNPPKAFNEVHVTLEFTKEPGSAKEIRRRFVTEANMPKVGELALKEPQTQLWLLDGDGVVLKKFEPWSIEGEITGVAGDAFRVVIFCDPALLKKTKKIDLRPASK
ncbi:MAG: hypothetical protein C0467_07345 [Planctomycetaceae bacterium]|nr:hypothetical protein [Planctomycetaceae bacterium]